MTSIDPALIKLIGATCGNACTNLVGKPNLADYPILTIELTPCDRVTHYWILDAIGSVEHRRSTLWPIAAFFPSAITNSTRILL
jgi:hypothetical protein